MKTKILGGIFTLAVMVVLGYGVSRSMEKDTDLSEMALKNVEALGQNEGPSTGVTCEGTGKAICPLDNLSYKKVTYWAY